MIDKNKNWEFYVNENGKFFDFHFEQDFGFGDNETPLLFDYTYIDREFIISDDKKLGIGDIKVEKEIKSICELKIKLEKLLLATKQFFYLYYLYSSMPIGSRLPCDKKALSVVSKEVNNEFDHRLNIKPEDTELLINQLVFDILFEKIFHDDSQEKISFNDYFDNYYHIYTNGKWIKATNEFDLRNNDIDKKNERDKAIKNFKNQIERDRNKRNDPAARERFIERGDDPDKKLESLPERDKNYKVGWDYLFYASNSNFIFSKQYRRNFVIDRDDDYIRLANILQSHDEYVETVIMKGANDTDEAYLRKSIDYYYLENGTRVDFMYKLAETAESEILEKKDATKLSNYNKIVFLKERYAVDAALPKIEENEIYFNKSSKQYNPFVLIKKSSRRSIDDILNESEEKPSFEDDAELPLISLLRAKVFELFYYHYTFISNDYKDIADFLRKDYDILSYHERNKIWKGRKYDDPVVTPEQKKRIKAISLINNSLFPEFDGWTRKDWRASDKNKSNSEISTEIEKIDEAKIDSLDEEDYLRLFGIDKITFEIIHKKFKKKLDKKPNTGGRPPKLTELDKLLVYIEYNRNEHSMEKIASVYGVVKSQISRAIKSAENIINEKDIKNAIINNYK